MPDGNLLIAFKWLNHEHHAVATAFFDREFKAHQAPWVVGQFEMGNF